VTADNTPTFDVPCLINRTKITSQNCSKEDRRVVLTPRMAFIQASDTIAQALLYLVNRIAEDNRDTPSAYSGADWAHDLLNGGPQLIRNELGVYRSTFTILLKAI
jgi:hypothetical protein